MPSNEVTPNQSQQRNRASSDLDLAAEAKPGDADDQTSDELIDTRHMFHPTQPVRA
jgi:hypothetical protein